MIRMVTRLAAVSLACLLTGCSYIAVMSAPEKRATTQRSDQARQADALFWKALHEGRYQDIDRLIEIHTAAYLKDPSDAVTAARTGWLHIWRLSESARMGDSVPATITNHAVLARKFFDEASRLDPGEARYTGFVGAARLAEGTIHHDEGLVRSGYYKLLEGVRAWPEFNLFTAGYDVRTPDDLGVVLDEVDRRVGLERLRALHVNDSREGLDSRRDRHADLGAGEIGDRGMACFLSAPQFEGLPATMETPGPDKKGPAADDVAYAFELRKKGLASRRRKAARQKKARGR